MSVLTRGAVRYIAVCSFKKAAGQEPPSFFQRAV